MDELIEGVEAVTIHIRDVRRAREFYGQVLGLREIAYSEELSRAVFALPGTSTALVMHVRGATEGGREPGTVTGVILSHHDPAAALAEIRRRGGTVTEEPATVERGGVTFVRGAFADPDGNEFLLRSPAK
jgi:predicted enzyme related to lactoylglutathione lyase